MLRLLAFAVLLLGLIAAPSMAQVRSADSPELTFGYFKGYVTDTAHIITSPARWENNDWAMFLVAAGTTAGLFLVDDEIRVEVLDWRGRTTEDISDIAEKFGNQHYILPSLAGAYLAGHIGESDDLRSFALLGLESFVISGYIIVPSLKLLTGRMRPDSGSPSDRWDGPSLGGSGRSFPSGHAANAFSVATSLALVYPRPSVKVAAYGVATLTALSRVHDDRHWTSDIFAGAVIGYFTARAVYERHVSRSDESVITLLPLHTEQGAGVVVAMPF